jgi:hypothetical protein
MRDLRFEQHAVEGLDKGIESNPFLTARSVDILSLFQRPANFLQAPPQFATAVDQFFQGFLQRRYRVRSYLTGLLLHLFEEL